MGNGNEEWEREMGRDRFVTNVTHGKLRGQGNGLGQVGTHFGEKVKQRTRIWDMGWYPECPLTTAGGNCDTADGTRDRPVWYQTSSGGGTYPHKY